MSNTNGFINKNTSNTYTGLALTFGALSSILNICCCVIGGIPIGIFFGIFGIAFAVISKKENKFSGIQIFAIVLSSFGIIIGAVLFFIILNVYNSMADPTFANEYLSQFREIFNGLPEDFKSAFPEEFKKIYGL